MKKWLEDFKEVVWVASVAIGVILYLVGTFATQSALAEKEIELKSYVDQKHEGVKSTLEDMKTTLERIDQRVYRLNARQR